MLTVGQPGERVEQIVEAQVVPQTYLLGLVRAQDGHVRAKHAPDELVAVAGHRGGRLRADGTRTRTEMRAVGRVVVAAESGGLGSGGGGCGGSVGRSVGHSTRRRRPVSWRWAAALSGARGIAAEAPEDCDGRQRTRTETHDD